MNDLEDSLNLSEEATKYLSLIAGGLQVNQINEVLGIDSKESFRIRRVIFRYFGTKDWARIIKTSIESRILIKEELVDDVLRKVALSYAFRIMSEKYAYEDTRDKVKLKAVFKSYLMQSNLAIQVKKIGVTNIKTMHDAELIN